MTDLADRPILAYRKNETPLSDGEIQAYLQELPGWQIVEREGIPRLEKTFPFKSFRKAMDFANIVADLADEADPVFHSR